MRWRRPFRPPILNWWTAVVCCISSNWKQKDDAVAQSFARLRGTNSHSERAKHWQSLSQTIGRRGSIDLSHALAVSFNSRILRSGSGPTLDLLLLDLQRRWDTLEDRFQVTVGLRERAYVSSKDPVVAQNIRSFLAQVVPVAAAAQISVFDAVSNPLWPRETSCARRSFIPTIPIASHALPIPR